MQLCGLIWKERNGQIFRGTSLVFDALHSVVVLRFRKWLLAKKEIVNVKLVVVFHNWRACMMCGPTTVKKVALWCPPSIVSLKFDVDEATRGKLGQASI